jgi:predicted nucleotidyltransferase
MVKTAAEVRQIINEFVQTLDTTIHVSKIVLFGSYAHGAPHEWSDIDVAVLSPNFRGLDVWRRQRLITKARAGKFYDVMVEALVIPATNFVARTI